MPGRWRRVFTDIDESFFRPHPFTPGEAVRIANQVGRDVYALLVDGDRPVAYGMLRGWEEGYETPSLGIAVRTSSQRQGLGRLMMSHLHAEAKRRGAVVVRLRVHPDNLRARRLYESIGYGYAGEDRGELVMLIDLDRGPDPDPRPRATPGGMTARLLDVDAPRWTSLLREAPYDFYHLPAYVAQCAANDRGQARALYVEDGARSMLLPLIVRDIPGSDSRDATSPYGYPGPIGPRNRRPELPVGGPERRRVRPAGRGNRVPLRAPAPLAQRRATGRCRGGGASRPHGRHRSDSPGGGTLGPDAPQPPAGHQEGAPGPASSRASTGASSSSARSSASTGPPWIVAQPTSTTTSGTTTSTGCGVLSASGSTCASSRKTKRLRRQASLSRPAGSCSTTLGERTRPSRGPSRRR